MSVSDLVATLDREGEPDVFISDVAELVGFEGDQPSRIQSLPRTRAGIERYIRVVGDPGKPSAIVLVRDLEDRKTLKTVLTVYRADLDGRLVRAAEGHGLIDKAGEPVAGSAKEVTLDVTSPSMKTPFRRELRFWLRRLGGKSDPGELISLSFVHVY